MLSGGRLRLGGGTGWNDVEYESLGMPYEERGKLFDEQIDILRKLWHEPLVDYHGEYHRIDRASILPRPTRPIPIWFGAIAPVAVRRAVTLGDGLLFASNPRAVSPMVDLAQEFMSKAGCDPKGFGWEAFVDYSEGADSWRSDAEMCCNMGGTHLAIRAMDTGSQMLGLKTMNYRGPQAYIDLLKEFIEVVR